MRGAASLLADIIQRGLGLDGSEGFGSWNPQADIDQPVLITLGGGHYAPRANNLGLQPGLRIGHMLATYALPFIAPQIEGEEPLGNWKQSINAAFEATKRAYPNGKIIFSMDKKAFASISEADQIIVKEVMNRIFLEVDRENRIDNLKAYDALISQGIEAVGPTEDQFVAWQAQAEASIKSLIASGSISDESLSLLYQYLNEYRASQAGVDKALLSDQVRVTSASE